MKYYELNDKLIIEFDDGFDGKLSAIKQIMIFDSMDALKEYLTESFDSFRISKSEKYIDCVYENITYTATIKEAIQIIERYS